MADMKTKAEILAKAAALEETARTRELTAQEKRELWLLQQEASVWEFLALQSVDHLARRPAHVPTATQINRADYAASPPSAFDLEGTCALPRSVLEAAILWNEPDEDVDMFDLGPKLAARPMCRPVYRH